MSYSKREKALAFWTLLIVGLGLIYTTGVSPAWKRYTQLTAEQADVDNDVKALEEQNRVNKQYRQRWKTLKGRLASADATSSTRTSRPTCARKASPRRATRKGTARSSSGSMRAARPPLPMFAGGVIRRMPM